MLHSILEVLYMLTIRDAVMYLRGFKCRKNSSSTQLVRKAVTATVTFVARRISHKRG